MVHRGAPIISLGQRKMHAEAALELIVVYLVPGPGAGADSV